MRKTYGADYPRTLGALLEWSDRELAAPAVTDAAGTLDWRAFQDRILRAAAGLREAGVACGDRVALWLPNGTDYLAAIFACARIGALAIHINTRFRAAEAGNLLRRSRAVALVTQWGFPPVDFPAIFSTLPAEDRAVLRCVLRLPVSIDVTELADLPVLPLDGAAADAGPDESSGETPCLTFTTSGTTSGPKLVLHDQQTIVGHAADVARRIGLDAADATLLGAMPFCGTFGNAAAMAAIAGGAHIVCLAQFDGEAAAALIRQHRVTHLIGGDDMFGRIAAASEGRPFELGALLGLRRVPLKRRRFDRCCRSQRHAAARPLWQFGSAGAVLDRRGKEPPPWRRRAGQRSDAARGARSGHRENTAGRRIRRIVDRCAITLRRIFGESVSDRTRD